MKARLSVRRQLVRLLAAGGLAAGTVLVGAPAAHAIDDFAALNAALDEDCDPGSTVTLGASISEPNEPLTVACDVTLDLGDHEVAVRNVVIESDRTFTVQGQDGLLLADARDAREGLAGIQTTGATLVVESGDVEAYGGAEIIHLGEVGGGAGIGGSDGSAGGTLIVEGGSLQAHGGGDGAGIGGGGTESGVAGPPEW